MPFAQRNETETKQFQNCFVSPLPPKKRQNSRETF